MRYWKPLKVRGTAEETHVTMVVASYLNAEPRRLESLACLLHSLGAQTYANWDAVVVHDGPLDPAVADRARGVVAALGGRATLAATPARVQQFGHPHRHAHACAARGAFVGFANDDGYYAPVYLETMAALLTAGPGCDLAHCDMVHSHKMWRAFPTTPRRGRIDVGCFVARRALIRRTPWTDHSFSGDGAYVEALARNANGIARIDRLLYVHN